MESCNIRIVLVAPSHPGNIGAAARALKNMELSELVLVSPRQFPHPEASARASGADDVLSGARVVPSLTAALAGCGYVAATTSRPRRRPVCSTRIESRGTRAVRPLQRSVSNLG
jgi:tRNA (cytidine32/uridine32-2'-O)-methyltransferase